MNTTLQSFQQRLGEAIGDLDHAEAQARLPQRWSVQQIVEHLILTYSATEAVLTRRISKGRPTQARPSISQSFKRIYVVHLGMFPEGVSAPVEVTPPSSSQALTGDQLVSLAAEHLLRMDASLDRTSALFGEHTKSVSHVILGPLSPQQWRRFHLVHGLHHIGHIRAILSVANALHRSNDAIRPDQSTDLLRQR